MSWNICFGAAAATRAAEIGDHPAGVIPLRPTGGLRSCLLPPALPLGRLGGMAAAGIEIRMPLSHRPQRSVRLDSAAHLLTEAAALGFLGRHGPGPVGPGRRLPPGAHRGSRPAPGPPGTPRPGLAWARWTPKSNGAASSDRPLVAQAPDGTEAAHRSRLADAIPEATDDAAYGLGIGAAGILYALSRLGRLGLLDSRPAGHASRRQMVTTLGFARCTARRFGVAGALCGWVEELEGACRRRWADAEVLPPYRPRE
jgi:hypothetical protein